MIPNNGYFAADSKYPFRGIDSYTPSPLLNSGYTPKSQNIVLNEGYLTRRDGYSYLGTFPLIDVPLGYIEFEDFNTNISLIGIGQKRQYLFDTSLKDWIPLGVYISDCEDAWTALSNITVTADSSSVRGNYSIKVVPADIFTTGLMAYEVFSSATDLSSYNEISLWVKASEAIDADALSLVITSDTVGGKSGTYRVFNLPAIETGWNCIALTGDSGDSWASLSAMNSIALYCNTDIGTKEVYLDDIRIRTLWTGTLDNPLTHISLTDASTSLLVISNNADDLYSWNGTDAGFIPFTHGISSFSSARALAVYKAHFLLGNVTTSTQGEKIVQWSNSADYDDFSSGDSGASLLPDIKGEILCMKPFENSLAIYSTGSIILCEYIGGEPVFSFTKICDNISLLSPRSVIDLNSMHLFMGSRGIYLFAGTSEVLCISTAIEEEYINALNIQYKNRAWCFHSELEKKVFFFIPDTEYTFKCFCLSYVNNEIETWSWHIIEFSDLIYCAEEFSQQSAYTWSNFPSWVNWENLQDALRWNNLQIEGSRKIALGDRDGNTYYLDNSISKDNQAGTEAYWESPDFTVPDAYLSLEARWIELEFEAQGVGVKISYSADLGNSWTDIETFSLTSDWKKYHCYFDKVASHIRFRFYSGNIESYSSFSIRWIRAWLQPLGDNKNDLS